LSCTLELVKKTTKKRILGLSNWGPGGAKKYTCCVFDSVFDFSFMKSAILIN